MSQSDQDYIRKAVELADGWRNGPGPAVVQAPRMELCTLGSMPQGYLDALAAQLVRQVDAIEVGIITTELGSIHIWGDHTMIAQSTQDDRTMNAIIAIVDSGVLLPTGYGVNNE